MPPKISADPGRAAAASVGARLALLRWPPGARSWAPGSHSHRLLNEGNIEITLTAVIGGALALIREVLEDRHGPGADVAFARHMLASLGVDPAAAARVCAEAAADLSRQP
jgi:hypothetical protein